MSKYFNLKEASDYTDQRGQSVECYLLSKKYFHTNVDSFAERYKEFFWITYCRRFKPLLIE